MQGSHLQRAVVRHRAHAYILPVPTFERAALVVFIITFVDRTLPADASNGHLVLHILACQYFMCTRAFFSVANLHYVNGIARYREV